MNRKRYKNRPCFEDEDLNAAILAGIIDDVYEDEDLEVSAWNRKPTPKK